MDVEHKNSNYKVIPELPCKFTMRPSEFSPLPVGVIEDASKDESDTETVLPVAKKLRESNDQQLVDLNRTNRALLLDPIVIPVEEEIPTINTGNVELDSKFIQHIHAARQERNKALHVV